MIDLAVGFMVICYGWMCLEWGRWKANEVRYLNGITSSVKLTFLFLFHTAVAPISATYDLMRRVR